MNIIDTKEGFLILCRTACRNTASEALGIEFIDASENQVVAVMPVTDAARQPLGLLHGGVNMVLAETVASMHCCWGIDLSKKIPFGIEINGSHLRPVKEGSVKAVGKIVRRTRTLVTHQVDIYHGENDVLVTTARVTNYYKKSNYSGRETNYTQL